MPQKLVVKVVIVIVIFQFSIALFEHKKLKTLTLKYCEQVPLTPSSSSLLQCFGTKCFFSNPITLAECKVAALLRNIFIQTALIIRNQRANTALI
jgi:hypothetical protein